MSSTSWIRIVVVNIVAILVSNSAFAMNLTAKEATLCIQPSKCAPPSDLYEGDTYFRNALLRALNNTKIIKYGWRPDSIVSPTRPIRIDERTYLLESVCEPYNCTHSTNTLHWPKQKNRTIALYLPVNVEQERFGDTSPQARKVLTDSKSKDSILRLRKALDDLKRSNEALDRVSKKIVVTHSEKKMDFSFWQIALAVIIGGWFLKNAIRTIKQATRRCKQEQSEKTARLAQEEYQRTQKRIARARALSNIAKLVSNTQVLAAKLPLSLSNAESWLDQAENEFLEGLYSPFWEAMEGAIQHLSQFEQTLRSIEAGQQQYAIEAPPLAPDAVNFSLGITVLPNPSSTNQRMKALYRQAQKNPHFAQIYEQRRTNSILIEGFQSLGEAINYLGDHVESELRSLGDHLSFRLGDIELSLRESSKQMERQQEKLLMEAQRFREEARGDNAELIAVARLNAENAEKGAKERRDMLDNIQHRRKPLWPSGGDDY